MIGSKSVADGIQPETCSSEPGSFWGRKNNPDVIIVIVEKKNQKKGKLTLRSLKKQEFLAQSTCEKRF